jgi:hypothetical protein
MTTAIQGDCFMSTPSEKGEWTKDLGGLWFICIFIGVFTGGVGLVITIPIAIIGTIYAIWEGIKGNISQPGGLLHYQISNGGRIEELDTMDIPHSGFSAAERRAEYMRRGQSPSGVIDGIYNDTYRPSGIPYSDTHRDWDADA